MLPPTRNSRETDSVMKKPTHNKSAFSLVELLVVIAVIAIIAAIAIPNIANITGGAQEAADQRNAQNLASTYNAAIARGMPTSAATTVAAAVTVITNGTNIDETVFRVDGVGGTGYTNYLTFQDGTLRYNQ
jgi:type IV pilus assembly protein PilA